MIGRRSQVLAVCSSTCRGLLHNMSDSSNMGCAISRRDRHGCPGGCAQYIELFKEEASHCEAANPRTVMGRQLSQL